MYDNRLAFTGASTITIGSIVLDQLQLVAIAFAFVLMGAALIRFGWRRNKAVSDR